MYHMVEENTTFFQKILDSSEIATYNKDTRSSDNATKRGGERKMTEYKIYITASELADMLGISVGHAYKIIRRLNEELKKDGFLVIAGKIPRRYFEKRWYGFGA